MQRTVKNRIAAALTIATLAFGMAACDSGKKSSNQSEQASRDGSYNSQVANQPAHSMSYSPTRDTINYWIDTWGKKNAVSYVYLYNGGAVIGYYVLHGLPVSYCAALTPPYQQIETPGDGSNVRDNVVQAPGVDGVYYSGGQCDTYYGHTADTNAYVEFSLGSNQSYLLYNQPLAEQSQYKNLGDVKQ